MSSFCQQKQFWVSRIVCYSVWKRGFIEYKFSQACMHNEIAEQAAKAKWRPTQKSFDEKDCFVRLCFSPCFSPSFGQQKFFNENISSFPFPAGNITLTPQVVFSFKLGGVAAKSLESKSLSKTAFHTYRDYYDPLITTRDVTTCERKRLQKAKF